MMGRLPVAPRPYRDELLSSWLGRVACRYGLDAEGLVGALFADREGDARTTLPGRGPAGYRRQLSARAAFDFLARGDLDRL